MARWALLIGVALLASGCANRHDLPQIGPLAQEKIVNETSTSPHCQYREPRTHRCYYFDPTVRKYFWEDGRPKS